MLLVRNQVSKPADDFDFHFVTLLKLFFYLLFFFFFLGFGYGLKFIYMVIHCQNLQCCSTNTI